MPKGIGNGARAECVVDSRETHLRRLVSFLGYYGIANGLFVLHPQRKRPLRALQLTAPDPAALPSSDLEGWLSQRAPQIHRIG